MEKTQNTTNTTTNSGESNTLVSPRSRIWMVTWPNPTEDVYEKLKNYANKKIVENMVFQLEKGENTGLIHYQIGIKYKNAREFHVMRKDFPGTHIEAGKHGWIAIYTYCIKQDTKEGETYIKKEEVKGLYKNNKKEKLFDDDDDPIPNAIEQHGLYKWQETAETLLKQKPNTRDIFWFYGNGNDGKDELAHYWFRKYPDRILYFTGGKTADITYMLLNHIKETKTRVRAIILNITRSQYDKINYTAIEALKGKLQYSSKYESTMQEIYPLHIFIFANQPPIKKNLTEDRWKIYKIQDKIAYPDEDPFDSPEE